MTCEWTSPEQISVCLFIAKQWFGVIADLVGLGTFALIAVLIWLFQRLRKDLDKWEVETVRKKELRQYAEQAAKHAEHRASLAETASHSRTLLAGRDVTSPTDWRHAIPGVRRGSRRQSKPRPWTFPGPQRGLR